MAITVTGKYRSDGAETDVTDVKAVASFRLGAYSCYVHTHLTKWKRPGWLLPEITSACTRSAHTLSASSSPAVNPTKACLSDYLVF
jgi:hypothetical protein